MKKIVLLLVVLICFVGCTNNQFSSLEEAKYVASQQPDFGSFVQAISVSSGQYFGIAGKDPFLWQTDPKMELEIVGQVGESSSTFVHLIIYEARHYLTSPVTLEHGIRKKIAQKRYYLLILNDYRPPQIVAKKELFSATVLIDK